MSLYFELNYKEIEEQIEIICNKIDELEEKIKSQLTRTLADNNHSPSQQISVDKREIDVIKQISNVGENPTLDTSYLGEYAEYKDDDEVKKC